MSRSGRAATAVVLVAALTGCGGDDPPDAVSGPDSGAVANEGPARIEIENFRFSPPVIDARRGEKIAVVNRDRAEHTVTGANGRFDTGRLGQGDTANLIVDEPGDYPYVCDLHQYMTGILRVS